MQFIGVNNQEHLGAWVPRSVVFTTHMLWLATSIVWFLGAFSFPFVAIFFPSRPSPRPVGVFFPLMLSSVWRVLVPFLCCGGSWLGCTVVPVMGALFQSRGWLPIVEAPGYFRHPTSILAMQLLICKLLLFILCNTIPCIYKCLPAHLKYVHIFNLINYLRTVELYSM